MKKMISNNLQNSDDSTIEFYREFEIDLIQFRIWVLNLNKETMKDKLAGNQYKEIWQWAGNCEQLKEKTPKKIFQSTEAQQKKWSFWMTGDFKNTIKSKAEACKVASNSSWPTDWGHFQNLAEEERGIDKERVDKI